MAAVSNPAVHRLAKLGVFYRSLASSQGLSRGSDRSVVARSKHFLDTSAFFLGSSAYSANSLFNKLEKLRSAAQLLVSTNRDSVFFQKGGFSSDPDLVEVTVDEDAYDEEFNISVTERGHTQRNIGKQFSGSSLSEFIPGRNFFTISSDFSVNTIHFEVKEIGGNRTALLEIAQEITKADVGVRAEVANDGDSFRIILTSDVPGRAGGFTVADLTGNAVHVSALDNVVLGPRDAEVVLNGDRRFASSNVISVQEPSVHVHLLQPTRHLVAIHVQTDPAVVRSALGDFVTSFNDVLAVLGTGKLAQSSKAKHALSAHIHSVRDELSRIGVEQDRAGGLTVADGVFRRALRDQPKNVEAILGGVEGIATKLASELRQITFSPIARLQSTVLTWGDSMSILSAMSSPGFVLDLSG